MDRQSASALETESQRADTPSHIHVEHHERTNPMEQPQTSNLPMLESNLDRLIQELHQLATRVKHPEQRHPRDESQGGQGQYLIASGRS